MIHHAACRSRWMAPIRSACLAAAVAAASAPAWSVTSLSFNGTLSNASSQQLVTPIVQFDFWSLGLDAFPSFQITQGEQIEATVTLDGLYTLPASATTRFIRLFLSGPDLGPLNPVATSGGIELFNGPASVLVVTPQICLTSTSLAACVSLTPPSYAPAALTFDKAVFSFTIDTLNGPTPVTVESALFDTVVTTPVPEASTWALLSAGLVLMGGVVRRRRSRTRLNKG